MDAREAGFVTANLVPNWLVFFRGEVNDYFENLFMIHRENAVPVERRFVEEIFLAAFPVGAGRAICGRRIKNGLESLLRKIPLACAVERPRSREAREKFRRLRGNFFTSANQFENRDWLQLAFDANQVEFAKDKMRILRRLMCALVNEDVRAVVFVEAFKPRREIDGVAEGRVSTPLG